MQNWKFLIFVLYGSLVSSHIIDIESETDNKWHTMILAVDRILDDFNSKQNNSLIIRSKTDLSTNSQSPDEFNANDLLKDLLQLISNQPNIALVINDDIDLERPIFGNNNLWIVDGFGSFWHIFGAMTINYFDSNGFFIIVLMHPKENHYEAVTRILSKCWTFYVANVVVLVPMRNYNRILLYTYFPYSDGHCEQVKPIVRNYFENNSFNLSVSHFPDKFGNFHQCTLFVAAADDEPYTFLPNDAAVEIFDFDGLDGMVVKEISRRLNFKMIVLPFAGGFKYEDMFDKVNISVAGHGPLKKYRLIDTIPYMYDTLVYVIPRGKPYSSFAKLFFPFKVEVWLGFCLSFLLMVIWISILRFVSKEKYYFVIGCNNDAPLLNLFSVIIGGSMTTHQLPQKKFARTILVLLLVTTLILRNAYLSKVFNFLRTQKLMEQFNYIKDIYDSDVPIYVFDCRGVSFDNNPELQKRVMVKKFSMDEIRDGKLDGAYCKLKNMVDYDNFINFRKPKILMTKDYIYKYDIKMWVREHTCLNIAIDNQIAELRSNGLCEYWKKMYTKTVNDIEDKEPKKLKIDQFAGIIEICAALYALSILMFIMELMASKYERIRTVMDCLAFKKSTNASNTPLRLVFKQKSETFLFDMYQIKKSKENYL